MADPRNSNRRPGSGVTADDFARAYSAQSAQPHFSAHRQYFGDSDEEEIAEAVESSAKTTKDGDRSHELRRDEMQYRTALKTAFELGHKAGLMQRNEIPPCSACERRKERNRIAAQASRMEKRRLERGVASDSSVETAGPGAERGEHAERERTERERTERERTERTERERAERTERAESGERAKRRRPTAGAVPPPFFQTAAADVREQVAAPSFFAVAAREDEEELDDEIEPPPF